MKENPNKIEKEPNNGKLENAIREIVEFIITIEKGGESFEQPPSYYYPNAEVLFRGIYDYTKNIINSIKEQKDIEINNNMNKLSHYIESQRDPNEKIKEKIIENLEHKKANLNTIVEAYKENPKKVIEIIKSKEKAIKKKKLGKEKKE